EGADRPIESGQLGREAVRQRALDVLVVIPAEVADEDAARAVLDETPGEQAGLAEAVAAVAAADRSRLAAQVEDRARLGIEREGSRLAEEDVPRRRRPVGSGELVEFVEAGEQPL